MLRRPPLPVQASAEHGFTLIELLVAMVCSIIVIGGLLAILVFSLKQQTRISDRVQDDRIGRLALGKMVDELRSSCTGLRTPPIQRPENPVTAPLSATNALNLWFVTGYGNSTGGSAVISGVTLHDVNWTSTGSTRTAGRSLGTLTDYSFTGSGEGPKWTFPSPLSIAGANKATVLARNVIPQGLSSAATIFQYYRYDNNSKSATDGELLSIPAGELPLTTERAEEVAKVGITFTQAPESGDTGELGGGSRTANIASSVALRFDPTETGSEVENEPCA
jgi:Tfp pilus assembly protein PilW